MEEVTVEINSKGETKISVKGVKGKSCKDLTKAIEAALGEAEESKLTGEYNEQEQTRTVRSHRA